MSRKTVLITGCSDGGLGAALALAFHRAGYRVLATARNPSKMASLKAAGMETLALDVLDETSVQKCVAEVSRLTNGELYGLVNNAGGGYSMPISDVSIPEGRKLFDLNVWGVVIATQAFLPLLRKSKIGAMVVNNTSVASEVGVPFQGVYNASKAAASMFSKVMRLELAPFGIKVIDLKTGSVRSKFFDNVKENEFAVHLPEDSPYNLAREKVESTMQGVELTKDAHDADKWATLVVKDLNRSNPPAYIWRGSSAFLCWLSTCLPVGSLDFMLRKMTGLDDIARKVKEQGQK